MICLLCSSEADVKAGLCAGCETGISRPLVSHRLATEQLPVKIPAQLYEYVFAGNGLFVRGQNPWLDVQIPVHRFDVRGLPAIEPAVKWLLPRVPVQLLARIWLEAISAGRSDREVLFYLWYDDAADRSAWVLYRPDQIAERTRVSSLDPGARAHAQIEIHSHHVYPARFSATDDQDEQGFKVYAVLGDLWGVPTIAARVGLHGYRMETRADIFFELPEGLSHVVLEERR